MTSARQEIETANVADHDGKTDQRVNEATQRRWIAIRERDRDAPEEQKNEAKVIQRAIRGWRPSDESFDGYWGKRVIDTIERELVAIERTRHTFYDEHSVSSFGRFHNRFADVWRLICVCSSKWIHFPAQISHLRMWLLSDLTWLLSFRMWS